MKLSWNLLQRVLHGALLSSCFSPISSAAPEPFVTAVLEWIYGGNDEGDAPAQKYARRTVAELSMDIVCVTVESDTYLYHVHSGELIRTEITKEEFAWLEGFAEDPKSPERRCAFVRIGALDESDRIPVDIGFSECSGFIGGLRWEATTGRIVGGGLRFKCCF